MRHTRVPLLSLLLVACGTPDAGVANISVVTTNGDNVARMFDVSFVLKDPTGNAYRRVELLSKRLLGPGESVATSATAPAGDGASIYTIGQDPNSSAIWTRYDHDAASVAPGAYTCVMAFRMDGAGTYSGCP